MENIRFRSGIYNKCCSSSLSVYFVFFPLRDADEIETWMLEKLQLAQEENYKVKHFTHFIIPSFIFKFDLYVNGSNRYTKIGLEPLKRRSDLDPKTSTSNSE